MEVFIDDETKLTLHGLRQHYLKLRDNEKNRKLIELLDALEFNQVFIRKYYDIAHLKNLFRKRAKSGFFRICKKNLS